MTARQRPFAELRDSGLLYLFNTSVLHPRGFAMSIVLDDDGNAVGWTLEGDGTEPWEFATGTTDEVFARAQETLRPRP